MGAAARPWSPGLIDSSEAASIARTTCWCSSGCGTRSPCTACDVAPERSVLFPYLQLHPALRFGLWADVLRSAAGARFFSDAERRLLHAYLARPPPHEELVGIGIDPSPQQSYPRHQQDPADDVVDDDEPRRPRTKRRDDGRISPAAACRSGAGIASTARSRSTADASSRTTAARRCSSTSTATRRRTATRRSC